MKAARAVAIEANARQRYCDSKVDYYGCKRLKLPRRGYKGNSQGTWNLPCWALKILARDIPRRLRFVC